MLFRIVSTCRGGGYHYCRTKPRHPKANSKGLYPLHRVLMENHRDEDKENNHIENLEVLSRSEHARHHQPDINPVSLVCSVCSSKFLLKPAAFRLRMKRSKHGKLFCSRSCGTKHQHKIDAGKTAVRGNRDPTLAYGVARPTASWAQGRLAQLGER